MIKWKGLIIINLGLSLLIIRESIAGLGVSITPSTWQIGDVRSGDIKNAGANYFTVTNTGTQFEKIGIKVSKTTPGGMKPGTAPGKDRFVLKFGNTETTYTTITETDTTLVPWIIDGDFTKFDLQFQAPTDTSRSFTEQQTITVTISAYVDTSTALENRTLPARAPWYSSVIVYIPQFTPEWGGTVGGFWCDKYECSQLNVSTSVQSRDTNPSLWPVAKNTDPGTTPAVSVANKPSWDYISYQQALKACRNRGSGFHLITAYEWAAVVEYAKQVYNRQIAGNNNNTATPGDQDGDTSGIQFGTGNTTMTGIDYTNYANRIVLTGSGPSIWSIDGSGLGPYDINGNIMELNQGLFSLVTSALAYIYDVTKVGNFGECTKGTGNIVILNSADDGTDLTTLSDNYWGTTGYYLLDSGNSFRQITGYTASTKTLSLATTPASGTYAYGIYKGTTTILTSGVTSGDRITAIRNSDADLKYYAVPSATSVGGDANYGNDRCVFDTSSNTIITRGGYYSNITDAGGFYLIFDPPTWTDGLIGFRACK